MNRPQMTLLNLVARCNSLLFGCLFQPYLLLRFSFSQIPFFFLFVSLFGVASCIAFCLPYPASCPPASPLAFFFFIFFWGSPPRRCPSAPPPRVGADLGVGSIFAPCPPGRCVCPSACPPSSSFLCSFFPSTLLPLEDGAEGEARGIRGCAACRAIGDLAQLACRSNAWLRADAAPRGPLCRHGSR